MFIISVVKCDDPGEIPNSRRNGTNSDYQNTTKYTCDTGFAPSDGNENIILTCGANGQWTGMAVCEGWSSFFQ